MRSSNEHAIMNAMSIQCFIHFNRFGFSLKCFSHFNEINEGFYSKQFDLIEHSVKISQGVGGQSECKWLNLKSSSNGYTTVRSVLLQENFVHLWFE